MSLISQNAVAKHTTVKKLKREGDGNVVSVANAGHESKKKRRGDDDDEQKQVQCQEETEMRNLENSLFGSLYSPVEFDADEDNKETPLLFITDRTGHSVMSAYEEDDSIVDEFETRHLKPAWIDEEEDITSINITKVNHLRKLRQEAHEVAISGSSLVARLRGQHVKLNPCTDWARLKSNENGYSSSSDDDSDVINGILRTDEELITKTGPKLQPGILEYSTLADVDANVQDGSSAPIKSVQFHRNGNLLLADGLDGRLRLFQIDGKRNPLVQSIVFDDCPVMKASFSPDGSQVIVSGRRKFFYNIDLVNMKADKCGPLVGRDEASLEEFEVSPDSSTIAFVGNEGYILLVSLKTKELIGTLKMNGTVRALAFSDGGQQLLSFGGDGQVYHWDLRTRTCFHKGVDEGCINGTALCCSPQGNMFAAGSASGIVNIYNRDEFLGGKRKPIKTLESLTTNVDFMRFNHDSQVLAICSSMKNKGLKLVHIPSFTVFSNWPETNTKLRHASCLDFSPGGGFMAVASGGKIKSEKSKVLLYKLHHYHSA